MRGINIKAIYNFMNISRVLIGLIHETLRYFPLGLVTIFVVLFYFIPDGVLGDIIHEWQKNRCIRKDIYCSFMAESDTGVCFCVCVFKIFVLRCIHAEEVCQQK